MRARKGQRSKLSEPEPLAAPRLNSIRGCHRREDLQRNPIASNRMFDRVHNFKPVRHESKTASRGFGQVSVLSADLDVGKLPQLRVDRLRRPLLDEKPASMSENERQKISGRAPCTPTQIREVIN